MWEGCRAGAYDEDADAVANDDDRRRSATPSASRTDRRRVERRLASRRATSGSRAARALPALAGGRLGRRRRVDGRRAGLTVSSLVSLSLEPPLVGISIALVGLAATRCCAEAGEWSASILGGDQDALAQHFARSVPPIVLWDGIPVREDDPRLIADAVGWLRARTVDRAARRATTRFFVGEVLDARARAGARRSLVYVDRRYRRAVIDAVVFDLDGVLDRLRAGVGRGARDARARARRPLAPRRAARHDGDELARVVALHARDDRARREPRGDQPRGRRADARALRRRAAVARRARSTPCGAGRAVAARARVVVEPRADRRRARGRRARRRCSRPRSRRRRWRAASRRPTSTSRRRAGSASSPAACVGDRGLAQRHPLREGRRNALRRDPEPALPAGGEALALADAVRRVARRSSRRVVQLEA